MENLLVSGKILLGVNYTLPISDPRKNKIIIFPPLAETACQVATTISDTYAWKAKCLSSHPGTIAFKIVIPMTAIMDLKLYSKIQPMVSEAFKNHLT